MSLKVVGLVNSYAVVIMLVQFFLSSSVHTCLRFELGIIEAFYSSESKPAWNSGNLEQVMHVSGRLGLSHGSGLII